MDAFSNQIILMIIDFQNWLAAFSDSTSFLVIKIIIGLYTLVLAADVIMLLIQRGISGDVRENQLGLNVPPELVNNGARKRLRKRWEKLRGGLSSGNEGKYKIMIIEADRIIDTLIFGMGFTEGETFGERLDNIPPGQVEDVASIKEAHNIRNRVVLDDNFKVDRELAESTMVLFEKFLITHMVIKD